MNTPLTLAQQAQSLAAADAYRRYRESVQRGDDQDIIMLRLRAWLAIDEGSV